ncbi:MAG: hypothetical protein GX135_01425 [Candidatus Cloacimonetes bacterium]|nr:hypothetical protein [Candidatus Cloacimonadota bacterium]
MKLSDLIGIGRLGGKDADGFYPVVVKPRFRDVLAEAKDVYLIFNSDRVFFVSICERDDSDRKPRLKFAEDGIAEERVKHREVILALPLENEEEEEPEELLGYSVVFEEREIGKVTDYFHNNAQYVLEVTAPDGAEILIPMVDFFIGEVMENPGVIILINAESLLSEAGE